MRSGTLSDMTKTTPTGTTLLAALWASKGNVAPVLQGLETGALYLTGNFKGREAQVVRGVRREMGR